MIAGGMLLLLAGAGGGWWYYQRGKTVGSEPAPTQAAAPVTQPVASAATPAQAAPVSLPAPTEQAATAPPATSQPAPDRTGGREPEVRRAPVQAQAVPPAPALPAIQTPVRPIDRPPAPAQQVATAPQQAAPTPVVQAPPPVVETPRPPAVRTEPAPQRPQPSVPAAGLITWSGKLKKNEAVAIDGTGASTGTLQGALPGVPVMIEVEPKEIGVAEAPGPGNGWRRLVLRSRADRNMVVTIRWQRLGN